MAKETDHTVIQDKFLAMLRRQQVPVSIYIVNGIKLQGQITAFDKFVVMLKSPTTPIQMIYKQAISTISPLEDISLDGSKETGATGNRAKSDSHDHQRNNKQAPPNKSA